MLVEFSLQDNRIVLKQFYRKLTVVMLRSRPCDSPTHSQDETSCDAGDVLIRSTRVPPQNQGREAGPELARSVQITVQKLRDPEHVQPHCNEKERRQEKPMRESADSQTGK